MKYLNNHKNQRGVALIIVLWMSIILTVLVSSFANTIKTAIAVAGTENSLMQHQTAIDSALELAIFRLIDRKTQQVWLRAESINTVRLNNRDISIRIEDPKGLIDINSADRNILKNLLVRATGNRSKSDEIVSQIFARRQKGTSSSKLRRKAINNRLSFRHPEELLSLPVMNADLYRKLSGLITVYSGQKNINPVTAPEEVLLSIPGLTRPYVEDFLKKRRQDAKDKRNYSDIIARSDGLLALSKRDVHILYITAPWGREGKPLGRRYVVATGLDTERPFRILSWSEYRG